MKAALWILLGACIGFALMAIAIWIRRRWQATADALTFGYRATPRHGLALTTERERGAAILTRRFYGTEELGLNATRPGGRSAPPRAMPPSQPPSSARQ